MKRISMFVFFISLVGTVLFAGGGKENAFKGKTEPVEVSGPVKITIWHPRGAGPNGEQIAKSVKEFNETNGKQIVVEEVYQGNYAASLSKVVQACAAGTNPTMAVLERAAGVPYMYEQGLLLDMMPYAKRDNFDTKNYPDALMYYCIHNGELISLPYVRSTPVFYYNKKLFAEAGIKNPPKTIDDLIAAGKKLTKVGSDGKTQIYGFSMNIDAAWYVQNMTYQLGSNMLSADGNSAPSLYDGTLLKVLKAWRQWVDEGWCKAPEVLQGPTKMKEAFAQGHIACIMESTGSMAGILRNAKNTGVDVGITFLPTWDKPSAPVGGGNIAIIGRNTTPQEQAAAWEFIKFLMTDKQVAENSVNTGYLPASKTSVNQKIVQDLWEKHPQYKTAFEQLAIAQEIPWSPYKSQYEEQMNRICGKLIQDRSISAEEAIKELQAEAEQILPQKPKLK